jgi:large subunit ribosomal protein L22
MPKFGYSVQVEGPAAMAYGKELRISPKHAIELCRVLRGMPLNAAKEYLEAVQAQKQAVPFLRHNKKLAHRKGARGSGQYPVKAAREILKILRNAEANATYKGLDLDKIKIVHISAYRGISIPGQMSRAFGRTSPSMNPLTNVEIILK